MKSIVTGSSGFIGSRLYSYLNRHGTNVIGVSRISKKNFETDLICDLEKQELDDGDFEDVSSIFHLAGHAHDLSKLKKLKNSYLKLNTEVTLNLAMQSARLGVKDFIFISTVKADSLNLKKNNDFYGQTKRKAELELLKLSKEVEIVSSFLIPTSFDRLITLGKSLKSGS